MSPSAIYILHKLFRNLYFNFAVNIVFFLYHGLTPGEILILDGVQLIARALSDYPSGMLADRFSKRAVIVCGCAFQFIAMVLMVGMPLFDVFVFTQILVGMAQGFDAGVASALISVVLKKNGQHDRYPRLEANAHSAFNFALATAPLAGAWAADQWGFAAAYLTTAVVMVIAAGLILMLPDPRHTLSQAAGKPPDHAFLASSTDQRRYIQAIVLGCAFFCLIRFGNVVGPLLISRLSSGATKVGLLATLAALVAMGTSLFIGWKDLRSGFTARVNVMGVIAAALFCLLAVAAYSVAGAASWASLVVLYIVLGVVNGAYPPMLTAHINSLLRPDRKATGLAVNSATSCVAYGLLVIGWGTLHVRSNVQQTILSACISVAVMFTVALALAMWGHTRPQRAT